MMSAQPLNHWFKCLATLPLMTLLVLQTGCANNTKSSSEPEAKQLTGKYPTATGTTDYIPKSTDQAPQSAGQSTTPKTVTNSASTTHSTNQSATTANTASPTPGNSKTTPKPVTATTKATTTTTPPVKKTTVEKAKPAEKTKTTEKTQAVVKQSPAKPAPVVDKAPVVKATKVDTAKAAPAKVEMTPVVTPETKAPADEVQLALAEPAPQNPEIPAAEEVAGPSALAITAADLPYSFGVWTLERNWDNQHPDTCRLISDKFPLSDGYEDTTLRAEVLLDAINIYTGSHIDLSYENSGIQIGDAELVPYSGLMGETNATVEGGFTDQLALAGEMTVNMGFWPTWPKTETQQVVIPLPDMNMALAAMFTCKNL